VFFVLPNKFGLLCKELLYTALTRSKVSITVFLHDVNDELVDFARTTSAILKRNTSIFDAPADNKYLYEPKRGVRVQSKIECLIYQTLDSVDGVSVHYEQPLSLDCIDFAIHPDFTVSVEGKTYYWEHLGMLDTAKYYKDWQERKGWYEQSGLMDSVITTDDSNGYGKNAVLKIIQDIKQNSLKKSDGRFSLHHYDLSESVDDVKVDIKEGLKAIDMINAGESKDLEYKSTLCLNLHTEKKDPAMEHSVLKTIVAFLNTEGGRLLIGYNEKNNEVVGIEQDFPFVKHNNQDGFGLKLDGLISSQIGIEFSQLIHISFETVEEKTLCVVDVKKSPTDAFLQSKGQDGDFYVRMNSSTERLNTKEYAQFKAIKKG
jgi:hypothetical protein